MRTKPAPLPARSASSLRRTLATKRFLDLSIAITMSIVAVPVVALCAFLVKLTSRGPAIYTQQRVGQFGRVFTIYKLRTMYHQCERLTGPKWSTPGDPRVTRLGKFMRWSHIDELPQLINVLRGEMSLIGPRPERPEIATQLGRAIEGYDLRSVVLPGISGHAQVHLPPDTSVADVRDKVRLDRDYLSNLSVGMDLKTLFRTALKVAGIYRP